MIVVPYDSSMKREWDEFVDSSKNATFLLKRDYMEYHSDRFKDQSLVFKNDMGRICALFPANAAGDVVSSHDGLTYGGLVTGWRHSGSDTLEMMSMLVDALGEAGFVTLRYKAIPHIYHRFPAEEDLYALFRLGAELKVRNMSTVIDLASSFQSSRLLKRAVKRQVRWGIEVEEVENVDPFWDIVVTDRWERHRVTPVHTMDEINYLKGKFPENIRIFVVKLDDGEVLGGAVIYLDRGVIHLQYAACTPKGKNMYATDVLYRDLIFNRLRGNRYFDFGISNENQGLYLNDGMVHHKEEFGGRSIVYDIYELPLNTI